MATNDMLSPVIGKNWQRSFLNLLSVELRGWWKSKRWIGMTLLWIGVINGIPALTFLGGEGAVDPAAFLFFYGFLNGMFPTIAVVLILQDSIVGEKKSGTASWVLSKPVTRKIFISAKLIGNSISMFIIMALIPGIIVYFETILITGQSFSFLPFFIAILLFGLNLLFYICFTLMLGTFQNSPGAVAGIPMVFNFTQQFILSIPFMQYFLPISMYLSLTGNPIIVSIILGGPIFSLLPVVSTGILTVLFLIIAYWRFEKEEF